MSKLGGYLLVDFEGKDISTSKTISGIYEKLLETKKRVVACNVKLGTTVFKELTLDVKLNGTSYELSNSILKITVTNANVVVGEEQTSGGSESLVFDDVSDLYYYIGENYENNTYFQIIATDTDSILNSMVGFGYVDGGGSFVMAGSIETLIESYDEIFLISLDTQARVLFIVGHPDQH